MNPGDSLIVLPVFFTNKGEVTELVPVPAFKAAVPQRELGKVGSIPMLSRHP